MFGLISTRLTFCNNLGEARWEELTREASKWPWWQLCQSLPNLLLRLSCFFHISSEGRMHVNTCHWIKKKLYMFCIDRSKHPLLMICIWNPLLGLAVWAHNFRGKMLATKHQAKRFPEEKRKDILTWAWCSLVSQPRLSSSFHAVKACCCFWHQKSKSERSDGNQREYFFQTLVFTFWLDCGYRLQGRQQQSWLQGWHVCSVLSPALHPSLTRFLPLDCIEAPENKQDITWYKWKSTSSLHSLSSSFPPVTNTCWFKLAALSPASLLGIIQRTLDKPKPKLFSPWKIFSCYPPIVWRQVQLSAPFITFAARTSTSNKQALFRKQKNWAKKEEEK